MIIVTEGGLDFLERHPVDASGSVVFSSVPVGLSQGVHLADVDI